MTKRKHVKYGGSLPWCLAELKWLEDAQEDPAVDEETWRQRGNVLLAAAAELTPAKQAKFHVAWETFQAKEAERTGMPVLPITGSMPAASVEQEAADREAHTRLAEILALYQEDSAK